MTATTAAKICAVNLVLAEAAQSQLRATHYKQRIDTGVYKDRLGHVWQGGLPEHGGTMISTEDLLRDELATMQRHIHLAQEHIDYAQTLLTQM